MLYHSVLKDAESFMEIPYSDFDFEPDIDHSGQEVQRLSVLSSLPELLAENYDMCVRRIIPKIREVVRVAAVDTQRVAGTVFLEILQRKLVPMQTYSQTFLPTILLSLDSRDPELSIAWLETLLAVMELLPKEIISKEVMYRAVAKGQLSQPIVSRLAACQILAKAATKFSAFEVRRDILSIVLSLCQDVEYEVRACMSRLLFPVAEALGVEETKTAILPELVELTKDEKIEVRLAGLDTLVSVLPLLDNDAKVSTVIPIFSNYCTQALEENDKTLSAIAQHYGKLCEALRPIFADEQKKEFLELYKKLCKIGLSKRPVAERQENKPKISVGIMTTLSDYEDEEKEEDEFEKCRQCAACNLPTMISFIGPKGFKTELAATLTQLCHDDSVHVRTKLASRYHEIAKLVGSSSHSVVADCFIKLLKDNRVEVFDGGLILQLSDTLASMSKAPGVETKMAEVLTEIGRCRGVIFASNNWRLQEHYVTSLACLPSFFTSDQIHQTILSVMFIRLRSVRALPVRRALIRTLLLLLRSNVRQEQREKVFQSLVKEFAAGKSCFHRGLFIDACWVTLELYSRSFFKEWFIRPLLALHNDRVPNIRLRLCAILPRLKSILKKPADVPLSELLENCVRDRLLNEKDRDVLEALNRATAELGNILVPYESQVIKSEEDKADDKKLEDEKKLLDLEEQTKKQEDISKETKKRLSNAGPGPGGRNSKLPTPKPKAAPVTASASQVKEKPAPANALPSSSAVKDAKKPLGAYSSRSATVVTSQPPSSLPSASSPAAGPSAVRRTSSGTAPSGSAVTRGRSSLGTIQAGPPEVRRSGNPAQRRTSVDNSVSSDRKK